MTEIIKEIIIALKEENETKFKQLLQTNNFNINNPIHTNGDTLAHFFAKQGNLQALDILIRNEAYFFHVKNNEGYSPFDVSLIAEKDLKLLKHTIIMSIIDDRNPMNLIFSKNSSKDLLKLYIYYTKYIRISTNSFNLTKATKLAIKNKSHHTICFFNGDFII